MDIFLAHPPLQPKVMGAQHVHAFGYDVSEITSSPGETLERVAGGESFIARSEHPQDYAGASGLLDSFRIAPKTIEEALSYNGKYDVADHHGAFMRALQKRLRGGSDREFEIDLAMTSRSRVLRFCELQGIDERAFLQDVSPIPTGNSLAATIRRSSRTTPSPIAIIS